LLTVAKEHGYEAEHVLGLSLGSTPDRVIAARALQRQDVFVTNNARDFRRLYAKFRTHPGLVIVLPSVKFGEQMRLFRKIIEFIESQPNIVDQMVTMRNDGAVTIEPWPRLVS